MEVIPDLPEIKPFDDEHNKDAEVKQAADWLLQHQQAPAGGAEPLSYELDISPGMKAMVELSDKPEIDFERRHEVKDEQAQPEPAESRMVPLSQILASYAGQQSGQAAKSQKFISVGVPPKSAPVARSLYSKALRAGILLGVVISCVGLAVFLIVGK